MQRIVLLALLFLLTTGCISTRRLQLRDRQVSRVVEEARFFTGAPYRWGGTTKAGMDCSGLLFRAFKPTDITLPRTSAQQAGMGRRVPLRALRSGDLLFFALGDKKRKITHAGMVTAVKGKQNVQFIHASTSRGVIETNLYKKYYLKRFRRARRVIR